MLREFEKDKVAFEAALGIEKYKASVERLKKIVAQEEKTGDFQAVEGDIDRRDKSLCDVKLENGFMTECGVKGSKLSGGQK